MGSDWGEVGLSFVRTEITGKLARSHGEIEVAGTVRWEFAVRAYVRIMYERMARMQRAHAGTAN